MEVPGETLEALKETRVSDNEEISILYNFPLLFFFYSNLEFSLGLHFIIHVTMWVVSCITLLNTIKRIVRRAR